MGYFEYAGKTSLNTVVESAREVLAKIGRSGMHALAPDEFEYYLCSLELLDSKGGTVAYMNFPVMPNSISEVESKILSISKTNAGVTTMFNSTFVPKEISLQGTFGRKLRLIDGIKDVPSQGGKLLNMLNGNLGFSLFPGDGEMKIKTGFGMINLLRRIVAKTTETDDSGMPYVLVFNNYALNSHYVVEVIQSSYSQNVENNLLWFYALELKAVAPSSAVKKQSVKKFVTEVASASIVQGIQDALAGSVRSLMQF